MKLSALLSIYHKEQASYFNEAMISIWDNQTLKPDEIVLVEDGPLTSQLYEVIKNWKEKLADKLKIIKLSKNVGTGCAKKIGVDNCSGEYIAVVDTDDICMPERFAKQCKFLDTHPEIDAIGTWLCEIDSEGNIIKPKVEYPLSDEELKRFFQKRDPIAHPTAMMRRSFLDTIGNYKGNLHLAEDTMLWYEGYKNGCKLANIDYIGLKFRRNEGFYKRRANWKKTVGLLKYRLTKINRDLDYGVKADVYAIAYFLLSISPSFMKKIAYKILR